MQVQSVLEPYCFILEVSADLAFKDITASLFVFKLKPRFSPKIKPAINCHFRRICLVYPVASRTPSILPSAACV